MTTPATTTYTFEVTGYVGIYPEAIGDQIAGIPGVTEVRVTRDPSIRPDGPNRERLIGIVQWAAGEHVKQQLGLPSEWNQGDWITRDDEAGNACGTACCIAGRVALDDGAVPVFQEWDPTADEYRDIAADSPEVEDGWATGKVRFPDHPEMGTLVVAEYARQVLGLTEPQSRQLFRGSNGYEDVVKFVAKALGTPVRSARRRKLRPDIDGACPEGEDCDLCYMDAVDDDPDVDADAPF